MWITTWCMLWMQRNVNDKHLNDYVCNFMQNKSIEKCPCVLSSTAWRKIYRGKIIPFWCGPVDIIGNMRGGTEWGPYFLPRSDKGQAPGWRRLQMKCCDLTPRARNYSHVIYKVIHLLDIWPWQLPLMPTDSPLIPVTLNALSKGVGCTGRNPFLFKFHELTIPSSSPQQCLAVRGRRLGLRPRETKHCSREGD